MLRSVVLNKLQCSFPQALKKLWDAISSIFNSFLLPCSLTFAHHPSTVTFTCLKALFLLGAWQHCKGSMKWAGETLSKRYCINLHVLSKASNNRAVP